MNLSLEDLPAEAATTGFLLETRAVLFLSSSYRLVYQF